MPLTTRQSEDLKSAVASYLRELGADKAFNAFVEEKNVNNSTEKKFQGLLEKKWITIPRLQKKITDLELQLEQVKKDAIGGGFTPREKKRSVRVDSPRPGESRASRT